MSAERKPSEGAMGDSPTSILAQISREMVGLYKEQFGRGPTRRGQTSPAQTP
jgi:hypothetical protein